MIDFAVTNKITKLIQNYNKSPRKTASLPLVVFVGACSLPLSANPNIWDEYQTTQKLVALYNRADEAQKELEDTSENEIKETEEESVEVLEKVESELIDTSEPQTREELEEPELE